MVDGAQAYTIVRNHLFARERPEADKAYDLATLGVQEKHHACPGEGSDEDSAEPEWFECGDGGSLGEPEGHDAAMGELIAASTPASASASASAPALTLIYGKTLPRAGVTTELLHRISGHLPRRDMIHLPEAWCDAPSSWTTDVLKETKEALCEACIRANAPRASPSGSLG